MSQELRRIDFEGLEPITALSYLLQILGGSRHRIGYYPDSLRVKYVDLSPEHVVDEEWVERLEQFKAKLKESQDARDSYSRFTSHQ